MPKIFPTANEDSPIDLEELAETAHLWLVYSMLAFAVLHVAAAVKHRFDGHDVLPRMTLWRR